MKEFNLEEAKNGKEVCTRDGHAARIICFDRKSNIKYDNIIALITDDNNIEVAYYYDNNGKFCECKESKNDLVMKPTKHNGWFNMYKNNDYKKEDIIHLYEQYLLSPKYDTESEANEHISKDNDKLIYIKTINIEWEE